MTDRDEERGRRDEEERRRLEAYRDYERQQESERRRDRLTEQSRHRFGEPMAPPQAPAPSARSGGPGSLALSGVFSFFAPGEDVEKNAARSAAIKRFLLLLAFYTASAIAFFVWNHLESLS